MLSRITGCRLRSLVSEILLFTFCSIVACRINQRQGPLVQQVTIYLDNYGVPHIVGETEEATFFGYGYAQAQDHLEQMMLQYRDAQGRRTEGEIKRFWLTREEIQSHSESVWGDRERINRLMK